MVPGVDHPVDKLPLSAEGVELQDFIIAITRTITAYINIYCTYYDYDFSTYVQTIIYYCY